MNNQEFYRNNISDDIPFFSHPLWLDFICPDKWDVAVVKNNNELRAAMPYMVNNLINPTKIIMPPFTKFLGPYLRIEKNKTESQISEELRLIKKLEKQLPDVSFFRQSWSPEYMNCLPFLWKDYQAKIKYCYIIKNIKTVELLWRSLNKNTRKLIRKAKTNKIFIVTENNPDCFFQIFNKLYKNQNLKNPYDLVFLKKLGEFIDKNNCGTMYFAVDDKKNVMSCGLTFHDKTTYYAFAAGSDPLYKSIGANAFLLFFMVKEAVIQNKNFNFLGSIIESKEKFIRSYGGVLYPYLDIIKKNSLLTRLKGRIEKCNL